MVTTAEGGQPQALPFQGRERLTKCKTFEYYSCAINSLHPQYQKQFKMIAQYSKRGAIKYFKLVTDKNYGTTFRH